MTRVERWLAEPLPGEVARAVARLEHAEDVVHVAVMPDVHLAREFCVGSVVATTRLVYPEAVGSDLGCGMCAVRLGAGAEGIDGAGAAARVLAALARAVPVARRHDAALPELPPLSDPKLAKVLARDARVEHGTLGRGNHFLELQQDGEGALWLMAHTGSRALGTAIPQHHKARTRAVGKGLHALDADGPDGALYLADLETALAYARTSRRQIAEAAAEALAQTLGAGAEWDTFSDCHHNFVRRETHFARELLVHRKGAISARLGEPGIVPGSMGTSSFHVTGRGNAASLCSCAHGAGRRLPRGVAARAISVRALREQMRGVWYDEGLAARLRDEAPAAYKSIGAVMRAQRELVRVERELRPVLSYKGV